MRKFALNKLVRDKIFVEMVELGQQPSHKVLTKKEFLIALKAKLLEEAKEFDPNDPHALKELADILEVIETAAQELGTDFEKLRELQMTTRKKRGAFDDKIYIKDLTLQDDDQWVDYYASEPERFPEVKV